MKWTEGLRRYGECAIPIFMQTMVMHDRNLEKIVEGQFELSREIFGSAKF